MSAEHKKLLWISISACAFILLVLALGFVLFTPKKGSAQAPAAIGNSAPPKAQDPQDFLSTPPVAANPDQSKTPGGNVIVVYGDKPTLPATGSSGSTTGSGAINPGTATSGTAASGVPASGAGLGQSISPATDGSASGVQPAAGEGKAPAPATKAKPVAGTAKKPGSKSGAVAAKTGASAPNDGSEKVAPQKQPAFWIQASSFASRGRADEFKENLANQGLAALIAVSEVNGKTVYRVRIGPYGTMDEANGWLSKLKTLPDCSQAFVTGQSSKKTK